MIARRSTCEHACSVACTMGFIGLRDPSCSPPSCRIHTPERAHRSARPIGFTSPNVDPVSAVAWCLLIGARHVATALEAGMLRSTRSAFQRDA